MMIPSSHYESGLFLTTAREHALFSQWTAGLSERSGDMPYGSQAHCIRPMRCATHHVFGLGDSENSRVLEIGFNLGHGAAILLGLGCAAVVSVEPRRDESTLLAEVVLNQKFPGRLRVLRCRSDDAAMRDTLRGQRFAMAYIDGDHTEDSVHNDIALCGDLGIPWLLLDDYFPRWGAGVQQAIERADLVTVALFGNFALCTRKDDFLNMDAVPTEADFRAMRTEAEKIRHLVVGYMIGRCGVDIGSQGAPVVPWAISFDLPESEFLHYSSGSPPSGPIHLRGHAQLLPFESNSLDFVFSSHLLEDFFDWSPILSEWVRCVKRGGFLILGVPDKALWNEAIARGQTPNCEHRHEATDGELSTYASGLGLEVIEDRKTNLYPGDYGILFVARKI